MKLLVQPVRSTAILPTKNPEDSGYDFYLDTHAFKDFEFSSLIPKDCTEIQFYDWRTQSIVKNRVTPITVIYDDSLVIQPGARVKIPLGWKVRMEYPTFFLTARDSSGEAFELPMNSEVQLRTKSGRGHNSGLVVTLGIGTVDSLYPGELFASVHNVGHDIVTIKDKEKFVQGVPSLVIRTEINPVSDIEFYGQRTGGFGSTGFTVEEMTSAINKVNECSLKVPTAMDTIFQNPGNCQLNSTYPEMMG